MCLVEENGVLGAKVLKGAIGVGIPICTVVANVFCENGTESVSWSIPGSFPASAIVECIIWRSEGGYQEGQVEEFRQRRFLGHFAAMCSNRRQGIRQVALRYKHSRVCYTDDSL